VQLVFDSDGLIKLNRAGVLGKVVEVFTCVIPSAVYREVVSEGKARRYRDAEAIEAILTNRVKIEPSGETVRFDLGLGSGESGVLYLLPDFPDSVVVSDDRRFLTVLSAQGTPYVTPADLVVALARRGSLSTGDARNALGRLEPAIRTKAYWDALTDLESVGE
jgi:hypothetical protein